jgi:hypothetical protein
MTKKRARRTRAEWSVVVSDLGASGRSMSAYARERGVSLGSLSYWKQKLAAETSTSMTPKAKPVFSEVVVVPRVRTTPARIEVVTRHGAAVRLEGGFDAGLLREVLRVVESC